MSILTPSIQLTDSGNAAACLIIGCKLIFSTTLRFKNFAIPLPFSPDKYEPA
jgi:hypothetical protein